MSKQTTKKNPNNASGGTLNDSCPNCGYCPHCGRAAAPVAPVVPFVPYYPPHWTPVSPWWGIAPPPLHPWPTWTSRTITVGTSDNVTGSVTTVPPVAYSYTA